MYLTITETGYRKEVESLSSGVIPVFAQLALGDGISSLDEIKQINMVSQKHQVDIIAVEQISAGAVKLHAYVSEDVALTIKEVGLKLSDGTLYAYGKYATEIGGLRKSQGFDLKFFVVISKEQLPDFNFTYEAINTIEIRDRIISESTAYVSNYVDQRLADLATAAQGAKADLAAKRYSANFFKLNPLA